MMQADVGWLHLQFRGGKSCAHRRPVSMSAFNNKVLFVHLRVQTYEAAAGA
jgi:ABC-type thiamine transport system ATPase subunit